MFAAIKEKDIRIIVLGIKCTLPYQFVLNSDYFTEKSDFDFTLDDSWERTIQTEEGPLTINVSCRYGLEIYSAMEDDAIRNSDLVFLIYSACDRSSLDMISILYDQIRRAKDTDDVLPIVILASLNPKDINDKWLDIDENKRQITTIEGNEYAKKMKALYFSEYCEKDKNQIDNILHKALRAYAQYFKKSNLIGAAYNGHFDAVQWLLDNGASISKKNNNGDTALLSAAANGHLEIMQLLLKHRASLNEKNNMGMTALLLAASNGHTKSVQWLLAQGALINEEDNNGKIALGHALLNSHFQIACFLASFEIIPDITIKQITQLQFSDERKIRLKEWAQTNHNITLHFTLFGVLKPESVKILAQLLCAGSLKQLAKVLDQLAAPSLNTIDFSDAWFNQEQLNSIVAAIKNNKNLVDYKFAPFQEYIMSTNDKLYLQTRFDLLPQLKQLKKDTMALEEALTQDYMQLLIGAGWQVLKDVLKDFNQQEYLQPLVSLREKITLASVLQASKEQSLGRQNFASRQQGLLTALRELTQDGQENYLQLLQVFWRAVHQLRTLVSDKSPRLWKDKHSVILTNSKGELMLDVFEELLSPASLLDTSELTQLQSKQKQGKDKQIKKVAKSALYAPLTDQIKRLQQIEKALESECRNLMRQLSNDTSALLSAKQQAILFLVEIRKRYEEYLKLIKSLLLWALNDYLLPRAYLQSGSIGNHWLTSEASSLAEFKEKEKGQSGTAVIKTLNGIHFKEKPHAPGIEFMVSRLGQLLAGQGATPTLLLKVIDGQGWPHLYQASKTVVGKELQTIIEHHPGAIDQISLANFSAMCILGILTDPQDGKPDNYMAEFTVDDKGNIESLEIIGIDNDIAFADVVIKKHESGCKQGQYFINVKNVLYFFPQMDQIITPEFKAQLLKIEPVLVLTDWLGGIIEQNRVYRELITSGVLTEIECHGATASERGLQLPIRLAPNTLQRLYHKLCQIKTLLENEPLLTHWQLLSQVQPGLAKHYAQVKDKHGPDIMACIHALYEEAISDVEELRNYQQQLAEGNTQVMTASVLKTCQEFGFEDNRNQHEREMLVEWLRYLRYEDYSGQETVKVIYDALKALSDEVESQPLLHWAAQSGLYELTKWLLANQLEDVNITNKQGYTALHMATKCANEALVLLLLQSGANRSAQTIYNKTPAMMASSDNPNKQAILTRIKGYLQRQSPLPDPNNISQSDRKHNSLPPLSVSRTTHVSSGGIFAAGRQLSTYQPSNAILEKQNEFKTELGF